MPCLVGEDCGINVSETACCQSRRSFQVHPPTHSSESCQVMIPFYLPADCALEGNTADPQTKSPRSVLGRLKKERSTTYVDQKGQNERQVCGNCAGILERQTSSSVCAADDKSTLESDLGCSLWLKAFIMLRRCFRVIPGIHTMMILPWAVTTALFKTVNPRQAQAEVPSIYGRPLGVSFVFST